MRIRVVRFRLNHCEVAQRRVLKMAQRKLDLAANGVKVGIVFGGIGERSKRLPQATGGAQRQGSVDLRLNAGLDGDLDDVRVMGDHTSSGFLVLRSGLSAGRKVRALVRVILGTTISHDALNCSVVRCSIKGADATTGTRASEGVGCSTRVCGPLASIGSRCAKSVTQVTAKWKDLICWEGCSPRSTAPGVSTAVSGATELAIEFPIISSLLMSRGPTVLRHGYEQLKYRRLAPGKLGY